MYNLWTHTNCSDRYCMLSSCVICETVWLKFRITRVSRSKNHVGEDPWKSIRLPYHIWASQQVLSLNVDARRQQLQQAVQVHHKHGSNCRFNLSNSTTFNQNLLIIRYVIYNFNLHISAFFNFHILSHIYIYNYIYIFPMFSFEDFISGPWPELRGFHTAPWQHPPSGCGRWNLPRHRWSEFPMDFPISLEIIEIISYSLWVHNISLLISLFVFYIQMLRW